MFKLVVLSALVAVALSKPQIHHSAIAYSAPNVGHSATFVSGGVPGSAISSSASSSVLNDGRFLSNAAHAVAGPSYVAYAAPAFRIYNPSGPVVSSYSTQSHVSSQGPRYSTTAAFPVRSSVHDNQREVLRPEAHPIKNNNNNNNNNDNNNNNNKNNSNRY